jgi:hypothetical protein
MKILILSTIILIAAFNCKGESDSTFISKTVYHVNYSQELFYEQQIAADSVSDYRIIYGIEINQFSSNSGFRPGLEITLFAGGRNDKRSFELAGYFDTESNRMTGLSFHHKYMFLKKHNRNSRLLEPYIFYNFIVRRTRLDEPLAKDPERALSFGYSGKTTYISMEHHIGLGVAWNITNKLYFHFDFGYGRYLGSIKKPFLASKLTGMYAGGDGWGIFSKFGFGIEL